MGKPRRQEGRSVDGVSHVAKYAPSAVPLKQNNRLSGFDTKCLKTKHLPKLLCNSICNSSLPFIEM